MKTMLVPIDFSDVTPIVIRIAADWAVQAGYRVHLLHVLPEEADLVGYETGMQLLPRVTVVPTPQDSRLMDSCRGELEGRGLEVTTRIVVGSPVIEIVDEAQAVGADLIVMGSHRHGMIHHLLLGSVSEGVLRRVTCPVLLVPAPKPEATAAETHEAAASQA
ncbi:MAG: universal stress protein [Planctomycetes bacterium]|nr:universal stress protein [Planctomycetota bacterium]